MTRWLSRLRLRVRSLFRGGDMDRELRRELGAHLAAEIDANIAAGMTPAQARAAALREFGPVAAIEEECRDVRGVFRIQQVAQDGRYAWRGLLRQPMFALVAALSIGLGVGVNLTIFGLATELLLTVPTAANPDRLVHIRTTRGSHASIEAWERLERGGVLAGVAGYQLETEVNWRGPLATATVMPLVVTNNFFDVLGLRAAIGRPFTADEASRDPRLAVISHGFWSRRLAADPAAVGQALMLNGEAYTITGVLPADVRSLPGYGIAPEIYVPMSPALIPRAPVVALIARMHDGQTIDTVTVAAQTLLQGLARGPADREAEMLREVFPVGGIDSMREFKEIAAFFAVLLVVTGLVLMIACANVAGLLLARASGRRREIALRAALGASRARLVQQMLTEGLMLSALGTAAGLLLALGLGAVLSQVSLPLPLQIDLRVGLDTRLAGFASALLVISALLCAVAPAIRLTRPALVTAMKPAESAFRYRWFTLRGCLVTAQIAASLVLMIVTALFLRNLLRTEAADPGFDANRLTVAQVTFVEGRQVAGSELAVDTLAAELQRFPGVESVAYADGLPLTMRGGWTTGTQIRIEGIANLVRVDYQGNRVGPRYFAAMGIRFVRGRDFDARDHADAPRVLIINEEFARRYLPSRDPIGVSLQLDESEPSSTIVGLVGNSKYRTLGEDLQPALYLPYLQRPRLPRFAHLLVRSAGPPETVVPAVREAILRADPSAVVDVAPAVASLAFAFLPSRIGAVLLSGLGGLALTLAMVGLYGVVAYAASRRTPEIGVRMALGATRGSVMRLVLADAGRLIVVGVVAGLGLAWLATKPLAAFLVAGLPPSDPVSFFGTSIILIAVSLLATAVPIRRAMRVDPTVALRQE